MADSIRVDQPKVITRDILGSGTPASSAVAVKPARTDVHADDAVETTSIPRPQPVAGPSQELAPPRGIRYSDEAASVLGCARGEKSRIAKSVCGHLTNLQIASISYLAFQVRLKFHQQLEDPYDTHLHNGTMDIPWTTDDLVRAAGGVDTLMSGPGNEWLTYWIHQAEPRQFPGLVVTVQKRDGDNFEFHVSSSAPI